MPRDLSASSVRPFSISAKASARSPRMRIAALACGFSKPGNFVAGTKPGGGAMPMFELGGKIGSAARADVPATARATRQAASAFTMA